jgi:hypothetical protein
MTAVVTMAADQRISKGVSSSLRWTAVDEWGDEVAAGGAVTVTVTRAAGTPVVTAQVATLEAGTTGVYAKALTAVQVGDLDVLTAVWFDNAVEVARTTVEVVGRFYFTVAELRASHPTFQGQAQIWTPQVLAFYRTLAEHEAEEICGRAFVPRYRRVTLDGSADVVLQLPDADIRDVASVSVAGTVWSDDQLADVTAYPSGRVELEGDVWPWGRENVVFAYRYGLDVPPPEVKHGSMLRAQELAFLGGPNGSAIPRRATSMSTDGTTIQLAQASRLKTGNPDVDAVYDRWSLRTSAGGGAEGEGGGMAPVSHSIDFNPQYDSLFHGGRR